MLAEMVNMIDSGAINGKIAKEVFADMFESGKSAGDIVKEKGLVQVSDESAILGFVQQAIAANPEQVKQFKEGKTAVLQFFVGQVMKSSRGKANPKSPARARTPHSRRDPAARTEKSRETLQILEETARPLARR